MKRSLPFFNWLIRTLVFAVAVQSGFALSLIDNPTGGGGRSLVKPNPTTNTRQKPYRLPLNPKNRPSADPIRFTMTCNKQQIAIGESVELTITARLLDIPSNLMFFLPGANGYSLKLLVPSGFQQTESDLTELVSEELTYLTKTTVTYRVRGYFVSAADKGCFQLLRGNKQATSQSLFETKATLCLTTDPKLPAVSSSKARAGAGSQARESAPQLYVRSSLTSAGEDSASLANIVASNCTNFAQVCSGNNQEIRTVTINVATAGSYSLTIGYRSPEGSVEGIVRINGVSQNVRFSQSGTFTTVNVPSVQLRAGDNAIGLSTGVSNGGGSGYLCFNSVCVSSGGSSGGGGCTPPPAPTITATTTQVCANNSATLTASNCSGTVTWSNGQTGTSISVSTTGTYSATCTVNSCASAPSNMLTLTACPTTTPTQPSQPISSCTNFAQVCSGNNQEIRTVTINVATAGSYPLTIGYQSPEGNVDGILRINGVSQNVRFNQSGTFTTVTTAAVQLKAGDNTIGLSSGVGTGSGGGYLCFNSICVSSSTGTCTPPPAPTVTASTTQVCANTPATLTASGCSGTVNWSNGQTGTSISVSTTGTYSASCTVGTCASAPSRTITLIACVSSSCTPPPAPTITATTTQVCANNSATLTASNCSGTVTWSNGQTGTSISVSTTGTYSATCTVNSCASAPSNMLTLTACPTTTPTQPSQPISSCTNFAQACSGNNQEIRTVTINVATAGSYPLTIGYQSPEGNVDGILRINGVSQNVRFNQSGTFTTVSVGSVQLKAGDNTIGLSSGVSTGSGGGYLCFNSVCVSSGGSSGGGGCTPPPAPTITATSTQACPDAPATLTASGCSGTVTWSNGQTGTSISVSTTGTYSATCTVNSCASTPSNMLTLTACGCANFAPLCSGNSSEVRTVSVNVATAGNYPLTIGYRAPEGSVDGLLRINGVSQNVRFSQSGTFAKITMASVPLKAGDNIIGLSSGDRGGYVCFNSVCADNGGACTPPPAPTLTASTTQVCANNPAILTASGCSGTVTWSTGQTGNSITVSIANSYSATCTTKDCPSQASSVTLITCPALPVSGCTNFAPVCSGNVLEVRTVTVSVAKADSYPLTISYRSPEGGVDGFVRINGVRQSVRFNQTSSFSPATIASVSLRAGDNTIELSSGDRGGFVCFNSVCAGNGGGCTPPPAPTINASATQVCPNTPVTLTASGCSGTVTWSTGLTGNSINVNTAGSYSAMCTTSSGCASGASASTTLTNCTTSLAGSCSIIDYSAETNITYKP